MAPKRKLPSLGLERRVRARKEEKWEPEPDVEASSEDDDDEFVSEEETGRRRLADDGSEEDEDDSQSGSEVCICRVRMWANDGTNERSRKKKNQQKPTCRTYLSVL